MPIDPQEEGTLDLSDIEVTVPPVGWEPVEDTSTFAARDLDVNADE